MAVIETFLRLMEDKRADRLVIASGTIPYLLRGDEKIELAMPVLELGMMRRIWGEITGEELAEDSEKTTRDGIYQGPDGEEIGYFLQWKDRSCRIEFHAHGGVRAEEPSLIGGNLSAAAEVARSPDAASMVGGLATPSRSAPPVPELLATIDQATTGDVTDIFLSSGKIPRIRKGGEITAIDAPPPSEDQITQLIHSEHLRSEFDSTGSVDFSIRWELSSGRRRFRINVFRHLDGVAAALRPIRQRIASLAELGLPEDLLNLISYPDGLVLVTGTSGSGKSTTIATLIDHLNRSRARHVITLEDPIEYEYREIQSLIHQREIGSDVESFSSGLRAALRENPDVIVLGELRDLDTISAALTAAETGHLVLGTLHSGSASSAVNRIVDVFPGHQQSLIRTQLASSLRAVVSQRLISSRGKGLVPALERLIVTPAVATGIREGQDHSVRNAMLTGVEEGMITLERSLASLVRRGMIDRDTALRHTRDTQALLHLLG